MALGNGKPSRSYHNVGRCLRFKKLRCRKGMLNSREERGRTERLETSVLADPRLGVGAEFRGAFGLGE